MRRSSVSKTYTKNPTSRPDPHEKPARYENTSPSTAAMAQVQRIRWIKTTALILFVVLFFYWLSPQGAEIANDRGASAGPVSLIGPSCC